MFYQSTGVRKELDPQGKQKRNTGRLVGSQCPEAKYWKEPYL